jgi:type IV secretory pathway TrbD component
MQEAPAPNRHLAFRSINKPLMFAGVERRLFFLSVIFGMAVFNLFETILGGIITFALLYAFSAWATNTDPQIIPIMAGAILNSHRARPLFDPAKLNRCPLQIDKPK